MVAPIVLQVDEDYHQAAVSSNQTITPETEFIIFGFPSLQQYQLLLFCFFLLIYLFTITGNGSIIFLVALDRQLHTPMYVFVSNLSFLDLTYATCLLSTVISYDRYVSICSPLYYLIIMTRKRYLLLIALAWANGFASPATVLILFLKLPFCGPNIIHHYYCDHPPLLQLAFAYTSFNIAVGSTIGGFFILITLTVVVVSYTKIILAILKINSKDGRKKTVSTCASHFAVVSIFYLPLIFMYIRPKASYSSDVDSLVALLYTVLTPMMNPAIYSLRNKDIIEAFKKKIHK
ncbi:olfactory receptor 6N2-like [Dendropsophus ebraccatus]|uniref:olfactory receptor 6N2-like n=1 Tax=Dendropsophus ebraccatus TaxID=150705 RepID=UPI0038321B81